MMSDYDTYRLETVKYIMDNNLDVSGRWSYAFGICTGNTLVDIYQTFRDYGVDCEHILAFDSFEGLPDEKPGLPKHRNWNRHEFNMKYIFKSENTAKIIQDIEARLCDRSIPIQWYEGYFIDVLNDKFLKSKPKPAFWVDLDVDLYISAAQVLDFMLKHKLILPGTILSYDDWGGTDEYAGGESLAHKEACDKYGVGCEQIVSAENGENVQKVFIVRRING